MLATTASSISYQGNGSTTVFSWPYDLIETAQLKVYFVDSSNVETLQTSGFTKALTGSPTNGIYSGATVTFSTAPSASYAVKIVRDPELTQEFDFDSEGDPLPVITRYADLTEMKLQALSLRIDDAESNGAQYVVPTGDTEPYSLPDLAALVTSQREVLAAARTYYISASGSDSNTGLSAASPKLTFSTLYNSVRDTVDARGYAITFSVAAGAYTQSFACDGPLFGLNSEADCVVSFASGVSISTTNVPCLDAYNGAWVTFTGSTTTLAASGTFAYGIRIWTDARALFGGFTFGACALYHIYLAEGYGRLTANCTINGNAQIGALIEVNGELDFSSYTITFSGSVTYSGFRASAFLVAGEGSYVALHSVAFSGTFTGRKYFNSDLAQPLPINKLEDIPGSLEGVWTTPFVSTPQGRITLESGVPVSTSDQTAKTTVYYQPYEGDYAPFSLNDANTYEMCTIGASGLSLALDSDSGHTGYHQSGKNFDLFLYRRGSTAVFTLATGPAWTDDTTRSAAISRPNGILANTSSMTVRFGTGSSDTESLSAGEGVYVGTIRCSANGQTADATATRYVYNEYNQLPRDSKAKTGSPFYDSGELALVREGTFTPVLTFATAGDLAVTYNTQTGDYIRVGNLVTVFITIITSAFTHSTASGQMQITGLPFTSVASRAAYGVIGEFGNFTKAGYTQYSAKLTGSSTTLGIIASGSGVGVSNVEPANASSGSNVTIRLNMQYRV